MIEKFLLAYKTFEISSNGTMGAGYNTDSFILDGKSITGKGITSVRYEGRACERTRIIIEGDKNKMERFVQERVAYYGTDDVFCSYGNEDSFLKE